MRFTGWERISRQGPGKSRQIIVRFITREPRFRLLQKRRNLRKTEQFKKVYKDEDLTKLRFKLLHLVKRTEGVKAAYTRDGRIVCIMNNAGNTKVTIDSPDDLFKIGVDDIDYQSLRMADL